MACWCYNVKYITIAITDSLTHKQHFNVLAGWIAANSVYYLLFIYYEVISSNKCSRVKSTIGIIVLSSIKCKYSGKVPLKVE